MRIYLYRGHSCIIFASETVRIGDATRGNAVRIGDSTRCCNSRRTRTTMSLQSSVLCGKASEGRDKSEDLPFHFTRLIFNAFGS